MLLPLICMQCYQQASLSGLILKNIRGYLSYKINQSYADEQRYPTCEGDGL